MSIHESKGVAFAAPFGVQKSLLCAGRATGALRISAFSSNTCVCFPKLRGATARRRRGSNVTMLIPPKHYDLPLTDDEKISPDYEWDPAHPGTLKPGTVPDNYPLEDVLNSDVYEKMVYEELDVDERHPSIYAQELEEDFLEWLEKAGRLIPRDSEDEDMFESEADTQVSGISEDDLDYADDDSKMIAYYSRQGDVSSSDPEFGSFSESTFDYDAGY